MEKGQILRSKTALEHLIFHSRKNVVSICRELSITPQQFTDWIKKRRPIPAERLKQLASYFQVSQDTLADGRRFARDLSPLSGIELEMVAVQNLRAQSSGRERTILDCRLSALLAERQKQIRLARLAAILEYCDADALVQIDTILDSLEKECKEDG